MPSEDAKPVKHQKAVKEEAGEEYEDEKSLGSLLKERKNTKPGTANSSKSLPKPKKEPRDVSEKKHTKIGSTSSSKVKKEESDTGDDDEPIAKRASIMKDNKDVIKKKTFKQEVKKTIKEEAKKTVKQEIKKMVKEEEKKKKKKNGAVVENGKKREKKVYDLPGQKRDPPGEREPLRIFYETLYKQIPNSEMAQFWMMESGLLPKGEAEKVFRKKQGKSQVRSPAKAAVSPHRSSKSVTVKKKILSTPVSATKKTTDVKVTSKQSKKRKMDDESSEEDSDDDFVLSKRVVKKQRAT